MLHIHKNKFLSLSLVVRKIHLFHDNRDLSKLKFILIKHYNELSEIPNCVTFAKFRKICTIFAKSNTDFWTIWGFYVSNISISWSHRFYLNQSMVINFRFRFHNLFFGVLCYLIIVNSIFITQSHYSYYLDACQRKQ